MYSCHNAFLSSEVPQRPTLEEEVMPGSVSPLSKIAAFMLLINILGRYMEDQRGLELF